MSKGIFLSSENEKDFIEKLKSDNYEFKTITEGGLQDTFLAINSNPKYKTFLFKEYVLNEWSSTHQIFSFKKCPKKYN